MKAAAVIHALAAKGDPSLEQILVHTGQHYDHQMSRVFFDDLQLPEPSAFLDVGSGSHAVQTARAMQAFEPVLLAANPDAVVVVGDVNSTLACALVAAKLGFPVSHVEAGLRSFDRSMPEEINRILTDQLSDLLFTPSLDANRNLQREGIDDRKVHFIGNVMIDTLVRILPKAERSEVLQHLRLDSGAFVLVTLHRPSNVDEPPIIAEILRALLTIAENETVVFPIHPRTQARIEQLGLPMDHPSLRLIEPLSYIDFLALQRAAHFVITDSGGVQEETTYLGVPCLTVRPNTERPVTIHSGTNRLVGSTCREIVEAARDAGSRRAGPGSVPDLWDGRAGERIAGILINAYKHGSVAASCESPPGL